MPVARAQFSAQLQAMGAPRRTFWDHPWVLKFRRSALYKERVRHWIEQPCSLTGRVHDLIGPLSVN